MMQRAHCLTTTWCGGCSGLLQAESVIDLHVCWAQAQAELGSIITMLKYRTSSTALVLLRKMYSIIGWHLLQRRLHAIDKRSSISSL